MTAFNSATHKLITSTGASLSDAAPVDARIMVSKLFKTLGVADMAFGENAPADTSRLWFDTNQMAVKRYDPLVPDWLTMGEAQFSLWLLKKAALSATTQTQIAESDLMFFYDDDAKEIKTLPRAHLREEQWKGPFESVSLPTGAYAIKAWSFEPPTSNSYPQLFFGAGSSTFDMIVANAAPQLGGANAVFEGVLINDGTQFSANGTVMPIPNGDVEGSRRIDGYHTFGFEQFAVAEGPDVTVTGNGMKFRYMKLD